MRGGTLPGMKLNVLCLKWGDKYSPDYVNRLYGMVSRNLPLPHRFLCLNDDPTGFRDGIEPLPLAREDLEYCWNKLLLFDRLPLEGVALYLDLDVVVTGDLTPLLDFSPEDPFVGVFDWNRPRNPQFNASVMRFHVNRHHHVIDSFLAKVENGSLVKEREWDGYLGSNDKVVFRDGATRYGGDQEWTSSRICGAGEIRSHSFPEKFVLSYKRHGKNNLPHDCRVMVFHGHPKPHEVSNSYVLNHWR